MIENIITGLVFLILTSWAMWIIPTLIIDYYFKRKSELIDTLVERQQKEGKPYAKE